MFIQHAKRLLSSRSLGLYLVFALSACSADPSGQEIIHKGAQASDATPTNTNKEAPSSGRTADGNEKSLGSPGSQNLLDTIQPLAKKVFDPRRLRTSSENTSDNMAHELNALNNAILELYQSDAPALRDSKVLVDYSAAILDGCMPGTILYCKNLAFFLKDNAGSREVSKIMAKELGASDVLTYYRYIKLAIEMQGRQADPELDQLVIARSTELFKSFTVMKDATATRPSQLELKSKDKTTQNELKIYVDLVTTTLQKTTDVGKSFSVQGMKDIFEFAVTSNLPTVLGTSLSEQYYALISRELKKDTLWPNFVAAVERRESTLPPTHAPIDLKSASQSLFVSLAPSYTNAVRDLVKQSPESLKMLQIDPTDPMKLYTEKDDLIYFYVISQVFDFQSLDSITPLWKATAKNPKRFCEILENYIRVYLAHSAMQTNINMSGLFKSIGALGGHPADFLTKSINITKSDIEPLWQDYFKRVNLLMVFYQREVEQPAMGTTDKELIDLIAHMKNFFDRLPMNVKYIVSYPNMLMFAYYAKKFDYKESFSFFGFSFVVDANLIMQDLMDGNIASFFTFTIDDLKYKPITKLEMMYAVYFAVQGNLLRLYDVSPNDWFNNIFNAYLQNDVKSLRTWSDTLHAARSEGSFYRDATNICDTVKNPDSLGGFANPFKPEEIFANTFMGVLNQDARPTLKALNTLIMPQYSNTAQNTLVEALEVVRSDINPKLRTLKLLRTLFSQQSSGSDQVKLLESMDKVIQDSDRMRNYIVDTTQDIMTLTENCVFDLAKIERQRRSEILEMEVEFERHVHMAMHAIYNSPDKSMKVADLRKTLEHPIWQDSFFERLDPDLDLLSAANDLLNKAAGYSQAFRQVQNYEQEYRNNGGIRLQGNGSVSFRFRSTDLAMRLGSFLTNGYNGKNISYHGDRLAFLLPQTYKELDSAINGYNNKKENFVYLPAGPDISFASSEVLFRNSAMEQIRDSIKWFFDMPSNDMFMRNFSRTLVALYKIRFEMETDPVKMVACDAQCVTDRRQQMRKESELLLLHSRRMLNYYNLNAELDDKKILSTFQTKTYFSDWMTGPVDIFINLSGANFSYLGLADDVYNFVISMQLGFKPILRGYRGWADKAIIAEQPPKAIGDGSSLSAEDLKSRPDVFADADKYHTALEKQSEYLQFPIPKATLDLINKSFTSTIATEMRLADAFEKTAEDYLLTHSIPDMQFSFNSPVFKNDYIISQNLKSNYHEDMRQFNGRTANKFIPAEFINDSHWTTLADH